MHISERLLFLSHWAEQAGSVHTCKQFSLPQNSVAVFLLISTWDWGEKLLCPKTYQVAYFMYEKYGIAYHGRQQDADDERFHENTYILSDQRIFAICRWNFL